MTSETTTTSPLAHLKPHSVVLSYPFQYRFSSRKRNTILTIMRKILMVLMLLLVIESLVGRSVVLEQKQHDGGNLEERIVPKLTDATDEPTIRQAVMMPMQPAPGPESDVIKQAKDGKKPNIEFLVVFVPITGNSADEQQDSLDDLHMEKRIYGYDRNAALYNAKKWISRRYGYFDTLASNIIKK